MRHLRNNYFFILIVFSVVCLVISGCGHQKLNVQDLLNKPIEEIDHFKSSKKYTKAGITVVYLTGSPYEIGLAHGRLCRKEISKVNKPIFEYYNQFLDDWSDNWEEFSKELKKRIPQEYLEEMRGISDGAQIDFDKILFLNALSTLLQTNKCFAFAFKENNSNIITVRQVDISTKSPLYKNMILYIIKPQKGYSFAAILNPGWVDGETGMNEHGVTVSQNNIGINQTEWDIMPITHLSRYMLQYSRNIDEAEQILDEQEAYPARLLFVSSKKGASIFEIANKEKARIDMKTAPLTLANHACVIASRVVRKSSTSRINYANKFLDENSENINIHKAVELVRSSKITWRWVPGVQNRQSFIFSPSDLDFWIAIPPDSNFFPASYGPYIGFNLRNELYGTGDETSPKAFPAFWQ